MVSRWQPLGLGVSRRRLWDSADPRGRRLSPLTSELRARPVEPVCRPRRRAAISRRHCRGPRALTYPSSRRQIEMPSIGGRAGWAGRAAAPPLFRRPPAGIHHKRPAWRAQLQEPINGAAAGRRAPVPGAEIAANLRWRSLSRDAPNHPNCDSSCPTSQNAVAKFETQETTSNNGV